MLIIGPLSLKAPEPETGVLPLMISIPHDLICQEPRNSDSRLCMMSWVLQDLDHPQYEERS